MASIPLQTIDASIAPSSSIVQQFDEGGSNDADGTDNSGGRPAPPAPPPSSDPTGTQNQTAQADGSSNEPASLHVDDSSGQGQPVANRLDVNDRRSSQASTIAPRLVRWYSNASSALSLDQVSGYLGVTVDVHTEGGKKLWLIKVTTLGRWVIAFHVFLAAIGIFNLVTSIFAWANSNNVDSMFQKILDTVAKPGSQYSEFEQQLQKWMNDTRVQSAADAARQAEQERLWDALIRVFENCGSSPGGSNTTACAAMRQHFDSNPLPQLDKSPLAKRKLTKLDVVIRRDHLNLKARGTGSDPWSGDRLMYTLAVLSILLCATLALVLSTLVWRKWGSGFLARLRTWRKKKYHLREEIEKSSFDAPAAGNGIRIHASGGDYQLTRGSLTFRGPKLPDAHTLAARGAWVELANLKANGPLDFDQLDVSNEYGTVLHAASRSGDLETVNYVLSQGANVNINGGRYHTVLQAAAHSGNLSVVERLLAAKASESSLGGFYGTSIHAAAEKGDSEMLEKLLRSLHNREHINQLGGTYGLPLLAVTARGDLSATIVLLNHGAEIDKCNSSGSNALHHAASNGHGDIASLLLDRGSDVNALSETHGTPLHAACAGGHPDVATLLLSQGADPSMIDQRRRTALHAAITAGAKFEEVVRRMLVSHPAIVNVRDADGQTALHLSSISGDILLVRILLAHGADCSIGDKFNAQPLFRATGCGHADIVLELLTTGKADPNARDCFGRVAIHGPAQTSDVRCHEYLLEHGADVNAVGNDMKTPLHEACNMGRIENVRLLLARKDIKINELDNDQFSPLYKALCSSDAHPDYFGKCVDVEIVKLLLDRSDIDVNVSDALAVQEAARKGLYDLVKTMLVDCNAKVQTPGGKYGGVLQAAAISGDLKLLNLILDPRYHADVNQPGGEYGNPLSAAAAFGHVELVRRLLEAGADVAQSKAGRYGSPFQSVCQKVESPMSFNWTSKAVAIRELLEEYGGVGVSKHSDKPYDGEWRWLMTPAGWAWIPPGEM